MIIDLGNCITVAIASGSAVDVSSQYLRIYPGIFFFKPCQKGGAKIETHIFIIIYDFEYKSISPKNTGSCVRSIAFTSDTFIPVMIRECRFLQLYHLQPGIFTRWLVKMAMDTEIFL
jgi:hypothetical protein